MLQMDTLLRRVQIMNLQSDILGKLIRMPPGPALSSVAELQYINQGWAGQVMRQSIV